MTTSAGRCLNRKTMLVSVKEYITESLQLEKVFVTCKNYTLLSKKNTQLLILGSQSPVPWDPNGVFWLAQKWLKSVCVCGAHQNVVLLVDAMDSDLTKTWSRRLFTILRARDAQCIGVNPVLALQLWKKFLIRNSTNTKMIRYLINVSGTLQVQQYWQPLQPLTRNTKRLW